MSSVCWYILVCTLLLLSCGYLLPFMRDRRHARMIGWSVAASTVLVSATVTSGVAPMCRMVVVVLLLLLCMKMMVAIETYSGTNDLKFYQWVAFAIGWFGMRAIPFERLPSPSVHYMRVITKGVSRIVMGVGLVYLSYVVDDYLGIDGFFPASLILLAGLSLILHFGILNLSAGLWRALGVNVGELFRSPYKSRSLKEFWGNRWNVAFSEMIAMIAYRPLKATIGIEKATLMSFLLSGVLHEIAISLSVRAGYGLPMLYFIIHAAALNLEDRSPFIKKVVRHRVLSRIWVMAILLMPLPLLFHRDFMTAVAIPFRDLILGV